MQVDADELIVPYGVGCLPALLRRCSRDFQMQTVATSGERRRKRCGGIVLNRMQVRNGPSPNPNPNPNPQPSAACSCALTLTRALTST